MSIVQLRSVTRAKLKRKSAAYGKRITSKKAPPFAITLVADSWLDGFNAAVAEVRMLASSDSKDTFRRGGPQPNDILDARVGINVRCWLDEMP